MSYDPSELRTLSAEAVALGKAIADAFATDSPGGKKVTKAEGEKLIKDAVDLAAAALRDLAD